MAARGARAAVGDAGDRLSAPRCAVIRGESMSSTQSGRTAETRRHLHYVLRMGNPESGTPMFDSVESWNWAVRISVVGLFVVALAVIAFKMASVVVPVVLAWVVAAGGRWPRAAGLVACAHIDCPGHPSDREHNGD